MFKKLFAIAAVLVGLTNPAIAGNTIEDHKELVNSLINAGVTVKINSKECMGDRRISGSYRSATRTLIICQDNAQNFNVMEPWTPNDLDTLRHEAHHVVQDCADGRAFDNNLVTMFEGRKHKDFVIKALSQDQIEGVIDGYAELGADEETIIIELEAFAVANSVDASNIANAVNNLCSRV